MKTYIKKIFVAILVAIFGASVVSCDKDTFADIKLVGVWNVEKMVSGTSTVLPADGDDDMFSMLVFSPDGTIALSNKAGTVYTGKWTYEKGKLTLTQDDDLSLDFDVVELKMTKLVFKLGDELVYYFTKQITVDK